MGTNPLPHVFQVQQTGFWCGPAAVRVALSCRGIARSQAELAAALGTTVNGTDSSADVVRVMNAELGAGTYAARYLPGSTATDEEIAALRSDLVAGVGDGFPIVANVVGTIRPLDGGSYSYPGGHYVAVTGYRNGGDEAFVSDVAAREYWVTTQALAVWIAERGYSYRAGGQVPIEGVDYAWSRPDPAGLYAAGKRFASRYLSHDRTGKNLTAAEAEALGAAGIAVVCNWEWRAGDAKGGFAAGAEYAAEAARQAAACGMPAGRPIYFSIDYDPAGSYGPIDAYFQGIGSVLPVSQIGAYGGYGTIDHLLGAGLIRWAWQTFAWSGGQWHPGAHVQQYRNGVTVAGGDLDLDRAMVADYGQWIPGKDAEDMTPEQARQLFNLDRLNTALLLDADEVTGLDDGQGNRVSYPLMVVQRQKAILAALEGGATVPAKVGLTDEALDDIEARVDKQLDETAD